MIKYLILTILIIFFIISCNNKNNIKYINKEEVFIKTNCVKNFSFKAKYKKKYKKILINIKLDKGYHAYSNGEKIGKVIDLKILSKNGWRIVDGPFLPNGYEKDIGYLGKSIILEGEFLIFAYIEGGEGAIFGNLLMQICTNNNCYTPKSYKFIIKN